MLSDPITTIWALGIERKREWIYQMGHLSSLPIFSRWLWSPIFSSSDSEERERERDLRKKKKRQSLGLENANFKNLGQRNEGYEDWEHLFWKMELITFWNFYWPAKTSQANAPHFAVGGLKGKREKVTTL